MARLSLDPDRAAQRRRLAGLALPTCPPESKITTSTGSRSSALELEDQACQTGDIMSPIRQNAVSDSFNEIATVRIELRHTHPLIWRQVEVPTSIMLTVLHDIIQAVMGWFDYHLWEFTILIISIRYFSQAISCSRPSVAPRHRHRIQECLHRCLAKAPAALMWPRLIVLANPHVEIALQLVD